MKLNALTIRQAEAAFRELADFMVNEPLLAGNATAGHLAAHHEAPRLFFLGLESFPAKIAVILLVAAVELEENVVALIHVRDGGVRQDVRNGPTESVGSDFDVFDRCFAHDKGAGIVDSVTQKASALKR